MKSLAAVILLPVVLICIGSCRQEEDDGVSTPARADGHDPTENKPIASTWSIELDATAEIDFVWIPSGRFDMGAASDGARPAEYPRHSVEIRRGFWLAATEITEAQWYALMGDAISQTGTARYPMRRISWEEAKAFCKRLARESDRTIRLPSEAEWEYACRAGSSAVYPWGDDVDLMVDYENIADQALLASLPDYEFSVAGWDDGYADVAPVGSFKPNAFGLYDMLGNVSEFCSDAWFSDFVGAPTDQQPRRGGWLSQRVVKGGNFGHGPRIARPAMRASMLPDYRGDAVGFRIVCEGDGD
jgi:formylglycine-generating enzyme required for sulfatase activity